MQDSTDLKEKKKRWIRLPISLGTHALVIEKDPTSQYNVISAVIIMYKVLWENQRERLLCLRKGRLQRRYTVWTGIKVSIEVFHEVKRQREWRWGWDWGLGWELVHWAGSITTSQPVEKWVATLGETSKSLLQETQAHILLLCGPLITRAKLHPNILLFTTYWMNGHLYSAFQFTKVLLNTYLT